MPLSELRKLPPRVPPSELASLVWARDPIEFKHGLPSTGMASLYINVKNVLDILLRVELSVMRR